MTSCRASVNGKPAAKEMKVKKKVYQEVPNQPDFGQLEEQILAIWQQEDTFRRSVHQRPADKSYVFYDGPPFATGLPHYGHLLAGTIKDIVPRYQAMRGYRVERRFGWDCHGLPIEALAQDALNLKGAHEILRNGVDTFNEQCRGMVTRYVGEWRRTVTRMGRWVDFDRDYKTMDRDFMESVWWVFKQIWDQGRIYRSYRIMPYSCALSTPLSNFEAGSNYKEVQDPSITVRLALTGTPETMATAAGADLLVWTTTPWTLPGNLAVAVGPEIKYAGVKVEGHDRLQIVAESCLDRVFPEPDKMAVVARCRGRDLAGGSYKPLFPDFAGHPNSFRVLADDFVSTSEGTGLVHMAPAYGEDDFRVCRKAGIEPVDYLDESGCFTVAVAGYAGKFCKDADQDIIRRLKRQGALVNQATMTHSYPFCERTDTPLIYRAIEAWYLRVEDIRDRLAAANQPVHWMPQHVGEKRFANWLGEARDWNISRNRFWGSCIPVWVADDGDAICVGSVQELEELSGREVTDLHKHFIDQIVIEQNGKTYRRTPEVLDCWFESGAMPLAQHHYPFDRCDQMDAIFPADFIAEGLDQTRGWFYTLLVLSVLLFDRSPYLNVVVNGLILAEDGKKMSKRLKNYPDPMEVIQRYGADALRLYMVYSPVVRAENLRFSESGVRHILRHLIIPWWNAYSFFVTYANVDGWRAESFSPPGNDHLLDRWIVSSLESLSGSVTAAMDSYDLQRAVRPFVHFIEDLTNWYIRRSRRRFWKSDDDQDKREAYRTLHYVLIQLSKIAAPFVPFISETIYRNLRCEEMPDSVHLCDFPAAREAARDPELEQSMAMVQTVVRLGRQLRTDHNLKVRQPLARLHLVCAEDSALRRIEDFATILTEELNVKAVSYAGDETELATYKVKPDFRRLGPRFGRQMRQVAGAIAKLAGQEAADLASGKAVSLTIEGNATTLSPDDVIIERQPRPGVAVAVEGNLLVAISTSLTGELIREGLAREFVSKVQGMRKSAGLEVTQRIEITFRCGAELGAGIEAHRQWISGETLALACRQASGEDDLKDQALVENWQLNGHDCDIGIRMANGPA